MTTEEHKPILLRKKDGKPQKKRGPPRKQVDEKLIFELSRIHCTSIEIAQICDCCVDILERHYMHIMHAGRSEGKSSLRRKQYQIAMEGNPGMLIWLGKQLLGQREPEKLEMDIKYTDYEIIISPKAIPHEAAS